MITEFVKAPGQDTLPTYNVGPVAPGRHTGDECHRIGFAADICYIDHTHFLAQSEESLSK